jgi:hypothetical protein
MVAEGETADLLTRHGCGDATERAEPSRQRSDNPSGQSTIDQLVSEGTNHESSDHDHTRQVALPLVDDQGDERAETGERRDCRDDPVALSRCESYRCDVYDGEDDENGRTADECEG